MNHKAKALQAAAIISDIIEKGDSSGMRLSKITLDSEGSVILYTLEGDLVALQSLQKVANEFGSEVSDICPNKDSQSITIFIDNKTHKELYLSDGRQVYTVKLN